MLNKSLVFQGMTQILYGQAVVNKFQLHGSRFFIFTPTQQWQILKEDILNLHVMWVELSRKLKTLQEN